MEYDYMMDTQSDAGLIASFIGTTFGMLISIAFVVVSIIAWWMIFTKAGEAGWKTLIPFYNFYIQFKIAFGTGWLFLLLFVPIANAIIGILFCLKLAKAFGKTTGFGIGLIFLNTIFVLILGFGDAEYIGVDGVATSKDRLE